MTQWSIWPLIALGALLTGGCARPPAPPPSTGLPDRDVVYGEAGGQQLRLDVYRCPTPGPHPAVLIIHGGGWYEGDKQEGAALGQRLSALGVVGFALNYRLAPAFHFPAQAQDCARAARWVRAHAHEYDVDPARLGAWGDSAGAQLALLLGMMQSGDFQDPADPNRQQSGRVQCVVDLYGPAEFRAPARWPLVAMRAAYGYFGGWPDSKSKLCAQASPAAYVTRTAGPVLLIHGDRDLLVPLQQSHLMKAALDAHGIENQLIVVPGAGHNLTGVSQSKLDELTANAAQWLCQHLAK